MDQLMTLVAMLMAFSGVLLGAGASKRAKRLEARVRELEERMGSEETATQS